MTIRKNFAFDKNMAKHLEELAKREGKTQTQIAIVDTNIIIDRG